MASRKQPRNAPKGPQANAGVSVVAARPSKLFADLPAASRWAGAFSVGALLIWSLLVPADSISVFIGEALPQNLGWMLAAVLCSLSVLRGGFPYSRFYVGVCAVTLVWLGVVSWHAGFENNARTGWYGFWQVIALAACYFGTAAVCLGPRSRAALIYLCVVGCIALSIHSLYQVTVDFPQQRARYLREPDQVLLEAGIDGPPGSAVRQRFEDRLLSSPEPLATFALANSLATLLSAGLVLTVSLLADATFRLEKNKDWPRWFVLAAVTLLILVSWFLTRSRTAYAAVVLAGLYWLTIKTISGQGQRLGQLAKTWVTSIAIGGLLLAAGVVWLVRNDELVLSEAQKSLGYRLEYWQAALGMIREHWLLGVGLGNFQSYYPQYKLELASEVVADPHNWLLDIAATLSLPVALVILVWLWGKFWPGGWRRFATREDAELSEKELSDTALSDAALSDTVLSGPEPGNAGVTACGKVEEADDLAARAILSGAFIGGLLCAVSLWLLLSLQTSTLVFWAMAVGIGYALRPLSMASSFSEPLAVRSAALAMVVCLLASGSWQASGIGVPFLILLAASQPRSTLELTPVIEPRENSLAQSRTRNVHPVSLAAAGFVCFVLQAWQPATSSWSNLIQAQSTADLERSLEMARQAARQDPLDSQPLAWLAAREVDRAANSPAAVFETRGGEAVAAIDDWLASDQVNPTNWQRAGDLSLTLYATAQQLRLPSESYLDRAVACYVAASQHYPSSVQLHVQLATAMALQQDWNGVEQELGQAVLISERTPHLDKKIENQTIWLPSSLAPELTSVNSSGSVPAEPLVDWLRKLLAKS